MLKLNPQQTINNIEKNFIKKDLPNLKIGDNVKIGVKIIEGNKERVQFYEGTIIAKKNSSLIQQLPFEKYYKELVSNEFF
jgi:large subunit ribosomal protein L19